MEIVNIIGKVLFLIMFVVYVMAYKSNLANAVTSVCQNKNRNVKIVFTKSLRIYVRTSLYVQAWQLK